LRERDAERPGGLHIDHELAAHGLLHGQVGGLGVLGDLV
jgi:hypothetical protein